jgi:predicted metal-dependent enzyme (double-stranded beta helix superfamily)
MSKLDHFLSDCLAALQDQRPQVAIKEILDGFISNPDHVKQSLGNPKRAAITTLHHAPDLTILNVTWAPHMKIYPHDHRLWALIGIYSGREDNAFYKREGTRIVQAGGKRLDEKESLLLGDRAIHAVENPLSAITGAVHIYGGDFFAVNRSEFDPDTLEERPYDFEKTKQWFMDANKFLC